MNKFFKILLVTLLSVAVANVASAQVVSRKAKDSTENSATKYITWNHVPTGTAGVTLSGLKVSGTVSGYALVQISTDTIPGVSTRIWEDLVHPESGRRDTVFFTDVATVQKKDFQLPSPIYFNAVRFKVVTSGTQKIYLYALQIKR
jgi:hypothetical protein